MHCSTTNGVLLDERWFEFAHKHGISIGSSYNATQEDLRHTQRDNGLSDGRTITSTIPHVQEAAEHGISIGVIDVLTKTNHPRVIDIYEFYKRVGVRACMNLIHKTPEAQKNNLIYVTPEERKAYEEETQSYFDYWATDKDTEVFTDRYASEYIELILTGHSGVCNR